MKITLFSPILLLLLFSPLVTSGQCPEFSSTTMTPGGCNNTCTLCVGDNITLTATGFNLPDNGTVDWYIDLTPGFDPYIGEGTLLGSSTISTPMTPCSPPPTFIGMMIDACGPEAQNEFMVFDAGGGFDVNDLIVDFDMHNNGGAGNDDIGTGFPCGFQPGNPNLISGCSDVVSIGPGGHVPAGGILVLFTGAGASTVYDMSGICPGCRTVYVLSNSCTRTKGAFSNHTSSGTRTTNWSIACGGGGAITYDCADLVGDGDQFVNGGISNGTCDFEGGANPYMVNSTVSVFSTTVPIDWCDEDYEIVGIIKPWNGSNCCSDPYTDRFSIHVSCPVASPSMLEACDLGNGTADFDLSSIEADINGGSGYAVEWYSDAALKNQIFSPYHSSSKTIYAVVRDGNCVSTPVMVNLIVLPLPKIKGDFQIELCEHPSTSGTAVLNMDSLKRVVSFDDPGLEIHFWEDAAHTIEIADDPYTVSAGTIFYTVSDGRCTAEAMIIIIINPTPQAFDIDINVCEDPPGSGMVSLDLNTYRDQITVGNPNEVHFYTDKDLNTEITPPYKTGTTTLYARVLGMPCSSDWVEVNIHVLGNIDPEDAIVRLCATSSDSTATFSPQDIFNQINGGRPLKIFSDDKALHPVIFPYTGGDTIFYGQLENDQCTSGIFQIILDVTGRPELSKLTTAQLCSDSTGRAVFDLENIRNFIANGDSSLTIILSTDSTMSDTLRADSLFLEQDSSLYAVGFNGGCYSDTVRVDFHIVLTPYIDPIGRLEACDSLILPAITGTRLTGQEAYYSKTGRAGMKWHPGDVIKSSRQIYAADNNRFCSFERLIDIRISPSVHAGKDVRRAVCKGTTIDLVNLLEGADSGGVFKDITGSGELKGSNLNTSTLTEGDYEFRYVRYSGTVCPDDSATIIITVVNEVHAGPDLSADTICSSDSIALSGIIRGDAGGTLIWLPTGQVVGEDGYLKGRILGAGDHRLAYVVGDGVTCPRDTAYIDINIQPTVRIPRPADVMSCGYYILPPISHIGGSPAYFDQTGGNGRRFQAGDTVFISGDIYLTDPDSKCSDEVLFHIELGAISYNNISGTLCPGTEITVNGKVYNKDNPKGTETLPGANAQGCDSIIKVDLSFFPPAEYYLDTTLCPGDALLVNGRSYDISNPNGTEILTQASAHQCDSTVHIHLEFYDTDTTVSGQYCSGESLLIGGVRFDERHDTDTLTLSGMAKGGCDSTIRVQLSFTDAVTQYLTPTLCAGDTVIINGNAYFEGKLTGSDTFTHQSAAGCDSILNITFQLLQPGRNRIQSTLCPDASLTVNGSIYDRNHPDGTEILKGASSNGCDSVIDISLEFYEYFLQSGKDRYEIEAGASVQVDIATDMNYTSIRWTPAEGASCTDCLEPVFMPDTTTRYTLTLTDSNGCSAEISILIVVVPKPKSGIYIPNTFSPNEDGQNDRFKVFADSYGGTLTLFQIYDRWGEVLYTEQGSQVQDPQSHKGWDGKSKGKDMLPGVYIYRVIFRTPDDKEITKTGDITLLR